MAEFFEVKKLGRACARLMVVPRVSEEGSQCLRCGRFFMPQELGLNIGWKLSDCTDDESDDGALGSLVNFVFGILERQWQCSTDDYDATAEFPLADVSVIVPKTDEELLSSTSAGKRFLCQIQRKMLFPEGQKVVDHPQVYDQFEILTDSHLSDVLDLIASLPAKSYVEIVFRTPILPSLCPSHSTGNLARMQSNSKRLIRQTSEKLRFKFRKLIFGQGESHFKTKLGTFMSQTFFRLPEIGRLVKTGLYSPKYLEIQICEVMESLKTSVARGFNYL